MITISTERCLLNGIAVMLRFLVYQKVAVLLRIDCAYCRQIGIDDYCLYEFHAALFRIF